MVCLRGSIDTSLNLELQCSFTVKLRKSYGLKRFSPTFLGKLLPSSVLPDAVSPYEVLHGKPPVYTALRVFGCKCYPYLRPYMKNKLDPKSLPCVFLGYNEKYKGYRCYYPPSGKVYISRHVLFEESSFQYSDINSTFHKQSTSSLLYDWRKAYIGPANVSLSQEDQTFTLREEEFPSLRRHTPPQQQAEEPVPPAPLSSLNGEEDNSTASEPESDDNCNDPVLLTGWFDFLLN
ncbi:hypothetical protein Bca101_018766 [Brassica carinata]